MPAVRRYEFGVSLYGEPVGRAAINVECSRADGFQEVENALSRLHNACHDAVSSMQLRSFLRLVCISTTPGPLKEWLGEEAYEQALLVAMLAGMLAPLAAGQGLTAMAQVRVRALALEKLRAGDGSLGSAGHDRSSRGHLPGSRSRGSGRDCERQATGRRERGCGAEHATNGAGGGAQEIR